jgi:putative PEP-CTERM system integral membrane protein
MASDNTWPLPRLAELRNVYWDAATTRLVDNKPMKVSGESWLPTSVPATTPLKPATHRVDFPNGETVVARPATTSDLPKPASGLSLAIVLDRSRSMARHSADVKTAIAQLSKAVDTRTTDVYLTASQYYGEAPSRMSLDKLNLDSIVYAGGQNAAELLAQFNALSTGQTYDAVFVLTDGSGYELGDGGIKVSIPNAPVWMVHLGGEFPLGYDDGTLEAIQASGGGVAGSVEEALLRLAVAREGKNASTRDVTSDVVDGYVWSTMPTQNAEALSVNAVSEDLSPFAARRVILAAMQREHGSLGQLSTLDQLHAIAVKHSVVTPYSSMIVLVEERQQKLLDELEARGDRFEREVEQVGETVPQNPFNVTGVPEPEEWLLLTLAAAMLVWYIRARRRAPLRSSGT